MFKKQNKRNIITFLGIENIKNIFAILLFILFFVSSSLAFEIKIGDAFSKLQTKIKRTAEIEIGGSAIVDDLYKLSLDKVQEDDMTPMFESFAKTVSYVNSEYSCQMDTQDIVNILYFANASFKRDMNINLQEFIKPNKDNMGKSCNKLNVCIHNPKSGLLNNTPTLNQDCQNIVEDVFLNFYMNSFYLYNIGGGIQESDYFWNNTLNDSSYDIMNDIYMLGKILFQDVEQPVKTLFFKMPSVDYNTVYQEPLVSMDIDWFSPYNNYYQSSSVPVSTISNRSYTTGTTTSNSTGVYQYIDDSIKDFVESVNINFVNPSVSFAGNKCISGFQLEVYTGSINKTGQGQTMEPSDYLQSVLEDVSVLSCNNDGICQNWETTTCPDCLSNGNRDFEEIESLLQNTAQHSNDQVNKDDPVLGCFQKCEALPCNATNCDKLVCYAKCSCQVYESPILEAIQYTGLSSAFKIKFCMIPVVDNKLTTNKVVYNISSIFTEISNVLQNLRNSGQLGTNVKTKEFLDTSKKENNFADQLSFSINSTTKQAPSNESEIAKSQKQLEFNTNMMTNILGFSKDSNLEGEKNKYVLMDDPCIYKTDVQTSSNPDQKKTLLSNCQKETAIASSFGDINLESAMKDQQILLLNTELNNFMILNRDFWFQVNLIFRDLVNTAYSLSQK